jgi:GntR family transcriptional repressor for pyruvate dehydrogenase complex
MTSTVGPNDAIGRSGLGERGDKIAEIIARQIVRTIASEHLAAGSRLPSESEMLRRFQVGRASLREALRILEVHGLIDIKPGPGGGPIVRPLGAQQFARTSTFHYHVRGATLRDLLEARRCMEPLMARLAATSGDPEVIAQLGELTVAARKALEDGDMAGWRELTSSFHELLAGASGNRVLDLFGGSLKMLYNERTSDRSAIGVLAHEVCVEHEEIVRAIVEGRADDAERLVAEHMETLTKITTETLFGMLDDVLDWR